MDEPHTHNIELKKPDRVHPGWVPFLWREETLWGMSENNLLTGKGHENDFFLMWEMLYILTRVIITLMMQETQVQSLGQEDPLQKGMAIHSSILAWRIPWTDHGVAKSRTLLSDFRSGVKFFELHISGRKWRTTKKSLDESERGEWKSWLKAQHSEN